jgi:hypothetical protein
MITQKQKDRIENWWHFGEQDRPVILCACRDPGEAPLPEVRDLDGYWNSPEIMVNRELQRQNQTLWFGEAVPTHYPEFGAAALAIILGAGKKYIKTESIWAVECFEEIGELKKIKYPADLSFYNLIWAAMENSLKRSRDHHMLGVYCLGSPLDTLAGMMGTQNALIALASDPGASKDTMDSIFQYQLAEFEKYIKLLRDSGFDYSTNWHGIWCKGRGAAVQEDVSCMISTDDYEQFCLPYARQFIQVMDHSFYHLDGPGALRHLETIRKIPELKVIQWQPGIGQERLADWLDVIRIILNSKKSCHLYAKTDEIPMLIREVGSRGLCINVTDGSYENCHRLADQYDLEFYKP